jgi:cystathionine gamma-synthase
MIPDCDGPDARYLQCLAASISAVPITSTTFAYAGAATTRRGEKLIYARQEYPGCYATERTLARMEGATSALLFSSGMAAITSFFQALPAGAGVVLPRQIYWPQIVWLEEFSARYGLRLKWVDSLDAADLLAAVTPDTSVVWVEVLGNPGLRMVDVAALAAGLPEGVQLAVNATCLSPALVRPIASGADFVIHSASKMLGGHNDLMGGAISARGDSPLWQRLARVRWLSGNGLSARDSEALGRSLLTLESRAVQASATALLIARHLRASPWVVGVRYIGLPDHPDHAIAQRNLRDFGFGPLIGLDMALTPAQCQSLCETTRIWLNTTSYGSVRSTMEHRATAEYLMAQSGQNYLRLSVGLEAADDLVADFMQALDRFGLRAVG